MASEETTVLEKGAIGTAAVATANKAMRWTHGTLSTATQLLPEGVKGVEALSKTAKFLEPYHERGGKFSIPLAVTAGALLTADKALKGDTRGAIEVGTTSAAAIVAGTIAGAKAGALGGSILGPGGAFVFGVVGGVVGGGIAAWSANKAVNAAMDALHVGKAAPSAAPAHPVAVARTNPPVPVNERDVQPVANVTLGKEELARKAARNVFKSHPAISESAVSIVAPDGRAQTGAVHVTAQSVNPAKSGAPTDPKIKAALSQAQHDACASKDVARVAVKYGVVEVPNGKPVQHTANLPCPQRDTAKAKT